MPEARFEELLVTARKGGATEILFLAGEASDAMPHLRTELKARAFDDFVAHVRWACERALEAGFLPHTNIGALSPRDFERLAEVNASMGLMLENIDDTFNRTIAPQKSAKGRLQTLRPPAAPECRTPVASSSDWVNRASPGCGRSMPWPKSTRATGTCRKSSSRTSSPTKDRGSALCRKLPHWKSIWNSSSTGGAWPRGGHSDPAQHQSALGGFVAVDRRPGRH